MSHDPKPDPTLEQLKELARAADQQARRRAVVRPKKARETTEAELLDMGARRVGAALVFGLPVRAKTGPAPGESCAIEFIYDSQRRAWAVSLTGKPSHEELRRELRARGRGLWDDAADAPDIAFQAVQGIIQCVETFGARPATDDQRDAMQSSVLAFVKSLRGNKGIKLQLAYDLLANEAAWAGTHKIPLLQECCLLLAAELQRPPTKQELKTRYTGAGQRVDDSTFAELLRHAGLSWLRQHGRR